MRVATFNLFSGRPPFADGDFPGGEPPVPPDPDQLTAAVRELGADVLAIQEVDRAQPRSGLADQTALVAAALGADPLTGARFVRTVRGTPGESRVWLAGHPAPGYGIGLVSRLPVAAWPELRLSPAPGRYPLPIPSRPPRVLWLPDEPRAAVAVVLHEPRVTIACTHLTFVPGVNVRQLRQVRRWLLGLPGPRILLGDLNLPGSMPAWLTGWTSLVEAPTFPSLGPRVQLDHALGDGLAPGTASSGRAVHLPISDHRALSVDLHLTG